MHGPPATYSGDLYPPTVWPSLPRLDVLDTVALELGERRRKKWRALRDEVLQDWARVGFSFVVKEDREAKYPTYDASIEPEHERLMVPMVPGYIRLMRTKTLLGGSVPAFAVFAHPGAWAAFKMGRAYWLRSGFWRRFVLPHEFGHCLGLQHRPPEHATSCMSAAYQSATSDIHDRDSLREYWSLP